MRRRASWSRSRVAFNSWHKSLARSLARTSSGSSGSYSSPASIFSFSVRMGTPSLPFARLQVFVEADAVAERVDDLDALGIVEGRFDPRPQVLVALAADLPVELLDAGHPDEDGRAGAAVTVMLGQVQRQPVFGHLQVGRGVLREVVFPIDGEAEVIDVELLRLLHAEDAQDGDRLLERHGHCRPP